MVRYMFYFYAIASVIFLFLFIINTNFRIHSYVFGTHERISYGNIFMTNRGNMRNISSVKSRTKDKNDTDTLILPNSTRGRGVLDRDLRPESFTTRPTQPHLNSLKNFSTIHQRVNHTKSPSSIPNETTRYQTTQPRKYIRDTRKGHYMKIVGAWGRLGNHIFFYAGLRGIGKMINYTPMIPADDPIFKLFNINRNYSVPISPMRNIEKRGTAGIGIYTPELMQPPERDVNLTISGYLQTWKYFQHIDAEIRKELTLKDEIKKKVKKIFKDFKITSRLKIGVHARRGDFINRPGTAIPNKEYFYKAMNMMRKLYEKPAFVVCSEDMEWVKNNLAGDDVYFVHENVEVDFGALVSCNHSIISSGTFGWWVAYLTNGTTIYYKDFPKLPLLRTFKLEDYYPPGWIGLL